MDPAGIGFLGQFCGGRTALWAPAFDHRVTASVSHCGYIPFRHSYPHDTGVQADFVVPGFAVDDDLEGAIACFPPSASLLISAGAAGTGGR